MIMRVLIQVPPEINVDIKTARGPVSVVERQANVKVHTGSGDLNLRHIEGDIEAFTGLGDCLVDAHRGGLDLEIMEGTVIATLDGIGAKGLRLRAKTGGIQCKVPFDASFELELRAEIGKGKTAYDLPVEALERGVLIRGTVRGGGPRVNLWSGRGNVSVSPKH
jgi:DUF4097 and DUF4098 domain-containing protein YvlB